VSPAVKNPFYKPESGVLLIDDTAVDRLLAKGVILGACNVALRVQSKMLSGNAGVTPEEAANGVPVISDPKLSAPTISLLSRSRPSRCTIVAADVTCDLELVWYRGRPCSSTAVKGCVSASFAASPHDCRISDVF
jgi:hypothetical protein